MSSDHFTDSYLLYLLAQCSHSVSHEFHAMLHQRGIEVSTWRILASLYPDRRISINELSRDCLYPQSTLTRMVIRLEEREALVQRKQNAADKRIVEVSLTTRGRKLAKSLVAEAETHEERLLQTYSSSQKAALKSSLRALRQLADDTPGEAVEATAQDDS